MTDERRQELARRSARYQHLIGEIQRKYGRKGWMLHRASVAHIKAWHVLARFISRAQQLNFELREDAKVQAYLASGYRPPALKSARRRRPPITAATMRQLIERADGACERCRYTRKLHAHHVVPCSAGGDSQLHNLLLLCPNCHAEAHDELRAAKLEAA